MRGRGEFPLDLGESAASDRTETDLKLARGLGGPQTVSRMGTLGDNPIRRVEDDALSRATTAEDFASLTLALDCSEGLVVGVLGKWGSGKTSFINMARVHLEDAGARLLDFNPWMFSGAEQLVESFFIEIAAQLKLRPELAEIGKSIEDYGESFSGLVWVPLVGPWIERARGAGKLFGKMLQHRKEGTGGRRQKVTDALLQLDKPIIVVLDDIDRLSTQEVRDIFKLVRLTASFPNVIYLVAFDRIRVEEALSESGVPGRDYLEKILQVAIDLPAIPDGVIVSQIAGALNSALDGIADPGRFDESMWVDVMPEVIQPLVRNMRDVRRYAAAVHGTVRSLDGQIALVDVLSLEAIRVFLPDVFSLLPESVEALTKPQNFMLHYDDSSEQKAAIDRLLAAGGEQHAVVRSMITRLFPAAQRHIGSGGYGSDWLGRWLIARRVAHADMLRLYLERVVGEGLRAFTDAEQAWSKFGEAAALDNFLRSIDRERLPDVISGFEHYTEQYTEAQVVPASTVLLNLLPELPERRGGMLSLDPSLAVRRVVLRLLRRMDNPAVLAATVEDILSQLVTLSAKLELITLVGHQAGAGRRLVDVNVATGFERDWREEVRNASLQQLVKEHDLLRVLLIAKRGVEPSESPITMPVSPELTAALLRAGRSDMRSQAVDSRAVHREGRLAWDALIEIFGDEATLATQVAELRHSAVETDETLLQLAERYAGGWRPPDFGGAELSDASPEAPAQANGTP